MWSKFKWLKELPSLNIPQERQFAPSPTMREFPGYEDVYAALLRDPEAMAVFRDHWDDSFKPHDMGPPPADATGQLRWYILRDLNEYHHKRHKLDFEDAKKHRVRQRVETLPGKLAQTDPLFDYFRAMSWYIIRNIQKLHSKVTTLSGPFTPTAYSILLLTLASPSKYSSYFPAIRQHHSSP